MNCPNCKVSLPAHTYEGLFDCIVETGKINAQLLEACELVIETWAQPPNAMTYNRVQAAIATAKGGE